MVCVMRSTRRCGRIETEQMSRTTAVTVRETFWWRDGWPGGLGGVSMILLGLWLKRWLPQPVAMGMGGFLAWFIVGLIYTRRSPPKYGIPRWLAASTMGVASGLTIGLLSYYFPW